MTIGITTYADRYFKYFRELLLRAERHGPDFRLVIAVNGHHDDERHRRFVSQLHSDFAGNTRATFLVADKPLGLSRLWNELIAASSSEHILLMNDDLYIEAAFWQWLRGVNLDNIMVGRINRIWSHFLVSRSALDRVGWFDEDFNGIGFEDFDFEGRLHGGGINISELGCAWIRHDWDQPLETSFVDQRKVFGKYSLANQEAFLEKWRIVDNEEPGALYLKQIEKWIVPGANKRPQQPRFAAPDASKEGAWITI